MAPTANSASGASPSSLRAVAGWTLLANIVIYSYSFYVSKAHITALSAEHKASLAWFEEWVVVLQAVGAIVIGIVADQIGTRAAINLTHLGSLAIYASAAYLSLNAAEQRRFGVSTAYMPLLLRAGTALQHTMLATQIAVCVGAWRSRAKAFSLLIVVNLAYQAGALCGGPLRGLLPRIEDKETAAAAAGLTLCCFLFNLCVTFPTATIQKRALQANGGTQLVALRPPSRGILRVLLRGLPAILLVLALRFGRLVLVEYRAGMKPSAAPLGPLPLGIPLDTVLQVGMYVILLLLSLFADGPAAFTLLLPGLIVAFRAATVFDPAAAVQQVDVFYVVLGLVSFALYVLPNAIIGIAAAPGTKGRLIGAAAAASVALVSKNAVLREAAAQLVKANSGRFTALSLSPNEVDFVVTAAVFVVAIILAPFVLSTEDANDAEFRTVSGRPLQLRPAQPSAATAGSTTAAAAPPAQRKQSPPANGAKQRRPHQ